MKRIKIPEPLGVVIIILIFFFFGGTLISVAFPILLIMAPVALIIFIVRYMSLLQKPHMIKNYHTIRSGSKSRRAFGLYENDIAKVADRIMYYKNKNKEINIIKHLDVDHKKRNKTKYFALPIKFNKDPWLFFNLPKDMEIKENI
jgi:hypothetical protein